MKSNSHRQTIILKNIWNKTFVFLMFFIFAFAKGNAQILEPVKWTAKIEKKSGSNAILIFDGIIEKDWHMYSQFTQDGGPLPLEIVFKNQKGNYNLVGKAKEGKTKTAFNDVFGVNETFFEGKAHIEQEITITNPDLKAVDVDFDFQVCKEVCINSNKKFSIVIPASFNMKAVATVSEVKEDETKRIGLAVDTIEKVVAPSTEKAKVEVAKTLEKQKKPAPAPQRSLWSIFFIAFLSGFATLLTPCVFPMIPMTVSFFTKQSKTRANGN